MNSFFAQLKQVLRRLGRTPLFTIVTLITLGAGVGANIAVFSVVEGVLLKPLPYPHAENLVGVWHTAPGLNLDLVNMAPSNYFIYREQNRVFEDVGIYQGDSVAVTGQSSPEQVQALDVTDGVLPVLGVAPMLGRWFNRTDVAPNAADTVMLSYGYWQRRFGADRSIVGRAITLDGKAHQIIGVMPRGFRFPSTDTAGQAFDLILPLAPDTANQKLAGFGFLGIARLRSGITIPQANSDITRLIALWMDSWSNGPGTNPHFYETWKITPDLRPLKDAVLGNIRGILWVVMATIGLVMLHDSMQVVTGCRARALPAM